MQFEQLYTSIWSFKEHGTWSTHNGKYPGNCSPKVIRSLLIKYTKENDIVLDQFLGGGTTALECLLLNRKIIGIDINRKAIDITNSKIANISGEKKIYVGNAVSLDVHDSSIDFICTHPPYWNIINYSKNLKGDLSLLNKKEFLVSMSIVAKESYRVLKFNKRCAIIIGDVRKNSYVEPLGYEVMQLFLQVGFKLKEIIIKEQHNCKSTARWINIAKQRNFLLIKHEYIFIFEKGYFK